MNSSNMDRVLLAAAVVGIGGLVGYQIVKECKKYKQEKGEKVAQVVNVDGSPIRLPNAGQYGFVVEVREVPTIVELVLTPQKPNNADIRLTISGSQIIGEQYNDIVAGKWLPMGKSKADVRPYAQLHVQYDYGQIIIRDVAAEGSPVLFDAQPVVTKSSHMVGPLNYLLLNGSTWVEGTA